jgi:hypothetical protein
MPSVWTQHRPVQAGNEKRVERLDWTTTPRSAPPEVRSGAILGVFGDYVRDIVARLTTNRDVTLALFELRLEAARHPELAQTMGTWQRESFAGDVAFNTKAGMPGGPREVALFHYAIDGLLFDRLTTPIDPSTPTDTIVDALVERLLSGA